MTDQSPGVMLPKFPPQTHIKRSDARAARLEPFTSVLEVMHDIPREASQLTSPNIYARQNSYDENGPYPQIITTGSYCYYPNGEKGMSVREVASLQGFLPDHEFSGTPKGRLGM